MASYISNLPINSERNNVIFDDSFVSRASGSNADNFIQEGFLKCINQIQRTRGQQQESSANRDNEAENFASIENLLNETQISLRNLKQNINVEIPEVRLKHHPEIMRIVENAHAEGRSPTVSDLGDLCQNSEFLDSLQNYSIKWIKEFKKVTQMDRDPASGTTLQEVTFWGNLERALHHIINDLRLTDEVALTIQALKSGKRFHATVTFESNTGYKFVSKNSKYSTKSSKW